MVLKDNRLRQLLWQAYFEAGLTRKQCVDKFATVIGCKTQIYDTMAQFDKGCSPDFEYRSQRRPAQQAGGFSQHELQCLKKLVDADRDLFYDDLVGLLDRRFNIRSTVTQVGIACTTSCKHSGLGYSHKLKKRIACEGDHAARASWRAFIDHILPPHSEDWDLVICLDEMHRSRREGDKRTVLTPVGEPAQHFERFSEENAQNFTLICGMNTQGVVPDTVWTVEGGVDAHKIYLWFKFFLCPVLGDYQLREPNSIVFLDNWIGHILPEVQEDIRSTGALLIFVEKYSSEWNPIEQLFKYIKHEFMPRQRKEFKGMSGAKRCVLSACEQFSASRARGAFKYCGFQVPEPLSALRMLSIALAADLI